MITILSVFPELLDLNGDAQNALVLAQRARWAGWDARVHNLALGDSLEGEAPQAVIVGSGAESSAPRVLEGLRALEGSLRAWSADGIPLLAKNIEHSNQQHEDIVVAILTGNPERAALAMGEHLEGSAALLRGFLS